MSESYVEKLQATIPNGTPNSNAILSSQIHDASAIGIQSPGTLDSHTFVIEVNSNKDASGNWTRLFDRTGTAVLVPAADNAMWYPELPTFPAFRITDTTGNVAADRTFIITKLHTT